MNATDNKLKILKAAIGALLAAGFIVVIFSLKLIPLSAGTAGQEPNQSPDLMGQQRRPTPRPPAGSHLHVVLRITEGAAEVVQATELPGDPVLSETTAGSFAYEVTSDDKTLAVETMPDPFEVRGFINPESSPFQGHNISRAKTATVIVKIPTASLDSADLDRFAVRLYKINPEVFPEKTGPAELQQMRQEGRAELQIELPGHQLGAQVRQIGRKIQSQ